MLVLVEERQQRTVSAYAPQHTVQICLLGHHGPLPQYFALSRRLTLMERGGGGTRDELTLLRSAGD